MYAFCMVAFPMLKFLTPAPQSPTTGTCPRQLNENSVHYVFYLLIVRARSKFRIKIFEIGFVTEI